MTANPINRMLPGSLAEGHYAHQDAGTGRAPGRGTTSAVDGIVTPAKSRPSNVVTPHVKRAQPATTQGPETS